MCSTKVHPSPSWVAPSSSGKVKLNEFVPDHGYSSVKPSETTTTNCSPLHCIFQSIPDSDSIDPGHPIHFIPDSHSI